MANITIDLASRVCTSSADVVESFEKPTFKHKENIKYNGYVQNIYERSGEGVLMTSGEPLTIGEHKISYNGKDYSVPFSWLMTESKTFGKYMSGDLLSSAYYKGILYLIYDSNNEIVEVIVNGDDIKQKVLDCSSAVFSSVYKCDSAPLLCTVKTEEVSSQAFSNHIEIRYADTDNLKYEYDTKDFIPLGDANSATVRPLNGEEIVLFGCEDIDNNRTRTFYWNTGKKNSDGSVKCTEIKWFGTVSVLGDITGEPIPDIDIEPSRQANGTYAWYLPAQTPYNIFAGYYINESTQKMEKIICWDYVSYQSSSKTGTMARVNISSNDTVLEKGELNPVKYFITNYADSKGIYYEYGPGWVRTYVRVVNISDTTYYTNDDVVKDKTSEASSSRIKDLYIFTFGCKTTSLAESNTLANRSRKETLIPKGSSTEMAYIYSKLNQRIYTVGGTNKGSTESVLGVCPFTVEVLPSSYDNYKNIRSLDMQIYSLLPLSWSFNKTLLTTASEDNRTSFTVYAPDSEHITLCCNEQYLTIEKTDDSSKLSIEKVADYYYKTNILDNNNLIEEDRFGSLSIRRSFIPYNMDCVLDIGGLSLTLPGSSEADSNNTWYWAASVNGLLNDGPSCSYLYSVVSLPIFIDATQLTDFTTEAIEQRGSILKANLKGLFDDYDEVSVYYTISTYSTTVSYRSTQVVKTNDTNSQYSVYGKSTYELDQDGTYYIFTSYSVFPIGMSSEIEGINYITPTVALTGDYSVRLVSSVNELKLCYNYDNKIYKGNEIFTIYGGNYYYDGQAVYYTGSSTNVNDTSSSNQFTCYALGLKYLAASGAEAFFYSEWEKRLFIFNASGTIQPADSLTNVGEVVDALYSSNEQMLYLLTSDNKLIMRSTTDTAMIEDIPDGAVLIGTECGAGLVHKNGYAVYSPRAKDSYKAKPLSLETEFLGLEGHNLKANSIEALLYKVSDGPVKVKVSTSTFSNADIITENAFYNIKPIDWKGMAYRVRITPKAANGQAFKVRIESEDPIAVSYIGFNVDDLSKAPNANRSGRTTAR